MAIYMVNQASPYDHENECIGSLKKSGGNTMTATIKSIVKSRTNEKTTVDTRAEITRGAVISMNAVGVVIGLWSLASLVSAMAMVGGPLALAKAWFSAVGGL